MLIDNKIDYLALSGLPSSAIKSVVDFIRKYTGLDSGRKGAFDIVTGFFTIAGLDLLYKELAPENKYRLVLSELTGDDDFMSRVINLLQGDAGIDASLKLSQAAKHAVEFLRRETVEVRAITSAFCHAKAYLFKDAQDDTHDYYVMGSSNLTESGLGLRESANVELNFAQTGSTNGEYADLRRWFKTQWEKVAAAQIPEDPNDRKSPKVDVKEYFIARIEECFGRTRTPEEIYYKILFELFSADLDIENQLKDQKEMTLLQDSAIYRTLFDYQKKGVISLIKMLKNWNGAILADAVGLGKTFSALAVMKYFQNNGYQVLMLCPKKLEQNWRQYLRRRNSRFERDEFDYIVRFHTDLQDDRLDGYDDGITRDWLRKQQKLLVVIDESHNLRNDKSSRYQMLLNDLLAKGASEKVRDVKVLMLSATPINNGLTDIRNQFKLIAQGDDAAFSTDDFQVDSLEQMFADANKRFGEWSRKPNRTIREFIDGLPPHFFSLTDRLIVARTRHMIEKTLGEDLGFPQKAKPANEYVGISMIGDYADIPAVYAAMLKPNLTAYQPTQYMTAKPIAKDDKKWDDNTYREKFLVKMMAVLFMKRLESCWFSCLGTIEKVLLVHQRTLAKVNAYLEKREAGDITIETPTDGCEDGDEEYFTLRDATIDLAKMERIDDFKAALEADVEALQEFYDSLSDFQEKFQSGERKDDKLDRLVQILEEKQTKPNRKALVFTTFGDTAKYLYNQLRAAHPDWRIACVTGQEILTPVDLVVEKDRLRTTLQRFAPYSKLYRELDWHDEYETAELRKDRYDPVTRKWNVGFNLWKETIAKVSPKWQAVMDNEIDVLIATDCLSEGQNLQDSDLVVNYDIHWNPVRLIQRFGRIDRIGSPNKVVQAVNFWPTKSYNDYLHLTGRVNNRMALMRLAGTETQPTDEELARIVADDPLIDHNTQKLIEQIASADIGEIEENAAEGDGDNLGLQDFSLEVFRQDLLDYFEKNRDLFRKMPAGVFSGFRLQPDLFEKVPESLVAVLGYPRRTKPEDCKRPYEHVYLMLQPAGEAPAEWKELSTGGILTFLRRNKSAKTDLPDWIVKSDAAMIGKLSQILKDWMKVKAPAEAEAAAEELFGSSVPTAHVKTAAENVFKPENFDLIAWEYVSR